MRVISGKYRGRKLSAPAGKGVRPTTDRVKEAIFSVIQFQILGARVLDLFAGSGALGIEALSRGAAQCVFVDNHSAHISIIKKNLERIDGVYEIICADYIAALTRLKGRRFDLVFLDPPYELDYYKKAMTFILENDIMDEDGMLVLEAGAENLPETDDSFEVIKKKTYGNTTVLFIKEGTRP